ncbi:MAG: ion transporter [Panacagrimonas sp.]
MNQPTIPLRKDINEAARRLGLIDWLMLLLAVLSVGLLAWEMWGDVDEPTSRLIFTIDYIVCAIFAVEFLWRWRAAGWTRDYVKRNWYEVLGMIPLQHPILRGFRLFRVLRILILFARFGRAADRALGDEFTYRLVNRFKNAIVESISSAVTVAVLDEVQNVLIKGRFARNIARALEQNQQSLRAMIAEKLRDDPQAGRLSRLPFAQELTEAVIDAARRVIEQVLQDPRTDELISDMLRENLDQIRASVQANATYAHEHPDPPKP